jgi:hypothetical protein
MYKHFQMLAIPLYLHAVLCAACLVLQLDCTNTLNDLLLEYLC